MSWLMLRGWCVADAAGGDVWWCCCCVVVLLRVVWLRLLAWCAVVVEVVLVLPYVACCWRWCGYRCWCVLVAVGVCDGVVAVAVCRWWRGVAVLLLRVLMWVLRVAAGAAADAVGAAAAGAVVWCVPLWVVLVWLRVLIVWLRVSLCVL